MKVAIVDLSLLKCFLCETFHFECPAYCLIYSLKLPTFCLQSEQGRFLCLSLHLSPPTLHTIWFFPMELSSCPVPSLASFTSLPRCIHSSSISKGSACWHLFLSSGLRDEWNPPSSLSFPDMESSATMSRQGKAQHRHPVSNVKQRWPCCVSSRRLW